ncbi:HD1 homeodomain mating-type protein Le.a1-3 [Lentinula lateritia]|nr:HD1 homeodomain mating-type protein Le.a1-3 [Lentinula lateritia]
MSLTDIDNRLLSSVDGFFDSLQKSDFSTSISSWKSIHDDILLGQANGTLDPGTNALGLSVSAWMEHMCDAFMNLEIKTEAELQKFSAEIRQERTHSPAPSRSPSPSLTIRSPSPSSSQLPSGNLPSYIPPSYTWLLSNLHNPYPSTSVRDSIASTTNTPRRLIDAWFVDVRRRIGWTNLIEGRSGLKGGGAKTHGKGTPGVRRPHKTLGPPPNPINNFVNGITEVPKYKTRKELVAAATRFFVRPAVSVGGPELGLAYSANANDLSASENQTFTVMADTARMLYREKLHPTELAVAVTSRVKQWTPGLGEMAKEVREEERRRKRSRGVKREDEEEEEEYTSDGKKRKRYLSPSDLSTPSSSAPPTPTDATFPTPTPTANLKRKRTVSFADPSSSSFPAVSPSTKRLRTALNSAALSRSVSDPTPMPASQQQAQIHNPPPPLTFSGFPAPILDSWFTTLTAPSPPPEGLALEKGFGNQWMDPLFFGFPDPVMRSDDAAGVLGDGSVYFDPRNSVDVTVPDLRTAFPGLSSLYGRTASSSSFNSSFTSSSSSPSTPALSASGSLTEEEYEERYVDGDGDRERDSLFGDEDGETQERERGVGGKALTPGDILNGGHNNNNNNNSSSTTSTNIFPDFPPTALAHPNSGSNLPSLPTLPDLSSLSSLPDLSSLSSLPTFPTFPSFSTFPNPSSSFDTFDFSSFPSLPEFNLDEFPEFLQGTQTQTQGGLDGDSGFGSNVNVNVGVDFGFGFGVGADAGNGDVDVDSFVAMIQAQAQSQDQPRDQDATQTQVPWAGPTPTREGFAISTSV